jgi:hypothetical protein
MSNKRHNHNKETDLPKSVPPNEEKKSSGNRLLLLILVPVLIILCWLFVPEWHNIPGGLWAFVSAILAGTSYIINTIGDIIDKWDKIMKSLGKTPFAPQKGYKKLEKAGGVSLAISLIAMLIGIVIFLIAMKNIPLTGKTAAIGNFLSNYGSMYMGDTGDIEFSKLPDKNMEFIYKTNGAGPHQWEYKYIGGEENSIPAKFAGVMLADGNWGVNADDGYDLRWYQEIRWEACIEEGSGLNNDGNVIVEFVAGGINWRINDVLKKNEPVPFPDSLPKQSLGIYTLKQCPDAEVMSFSLSGMPDKSLKKVIGGFGWIVSWAPNDVTANSSGTAPEQAKTFRISISEVQYIKDNSLKAFWGRNLEALLSIALVIFIVVVTGIIKATAPQKDEIARP